MDLSWKGLDDFPKELRELIISYMGSDEQLNMRLANTKWFKLVHYRNFTPKFTTEKTLPQIVDRMLQYNEPIGLKFVKSKFKKLEIYAAQLSRLTNLTSLVLPYYYEQDLRPEVWWSFTVLTNLREWRTSFGCPVAVTASLIKLQELVLNKHLDILVESVKKMSYLDHLECFPDIAKPLDVFSLLPCPTRLTRLSTNGKLDHTHASKLYNLQQLYYNANIEDIPLQLDKFTALNNLHISQHHLSFGALPTTLTYLAIEGNSLDPACHQHLTRLHKLNMLSIDALYLNDEQYSWISHMTSLKEVALWPSAAAGIVESFTGALYGMIKSSKLTQLSLQVMPHVDLGHLSHLTTLEEVFFYEDTVDVPGDYSFASYLTRLTNFSAYTTGDRPSLTALANLENLKYLKVSSSTHNQPARIPMSLERLTSLESLYFDKCEANVFERFSVLTRLTYLCANCLPDINYEFLRSIPLHDLRIMQDAHNSFYTVLVQLTGLQLLKIQGLSADQVIGLSSLQHLTSLDATNCNVGNGQNVSLLTSLQVLYVSMPSVNQALIDCLPNLVDLHLV